MPASSYFSFLHGRHAAVLTALLGLQIAGLVAVSRREVVPLRQPLAAFPAALDSWSQTQEFEIDRSALDVLRADEVLSRAYVDTSRPNEAVTMFVAYFQSQRTGQTPHSPKNCLPGSGWVPSESAIVPIDIPGRAEPIRVNRYIVSKGDYRSVVFYWYQTPKRVIASEYMAKLYLMADAIRYNRTDTALVRVVVPAGDDPAAASETGKRFVRAMFPTISRYFPD